MRKYEYVFLFSLLILFMPFDCKGMKNIERRTNDLITFLSRHGDKLLVVTLGLLYAFDYEEESSSEQETDNRFNLKEEANKEKLIECSAKIPETNLKEEQTEEIDLFEDGLGAVVPFLLWNLMYDK